MQALLVIMGTHCLRGLTVPVMCAASPKCFAANPAVLLGLTLDPPRAKLPAVRDRKLTCTAFAA